MPFINYKCIKEELENYLKGYKLKDTIKIIGSYLCTFTNKYDHEIFMSIGNGFIKLTVMQPNFIEELEIKGKEYIKKNELLKYIFKIQENTEFETTNEKEDITLKIRRIEKRTNGIIVTDIFKIYSSIDYSDNIQILSNLSEKQLIFTKNKLEQNLGNFHFNDTKACDILSRLKKLDNNKLQTLSDYNNSFSICINKNKTIKNMFNKNNILPIQVILNGTNISNMYNSIQGYDKLSRIHELYNGIITPRNEKDINGIKIGLLNS